MSLKLKTIQDFVQATNTTKTENKEKFVYGYVVDHVIDQDKKIDKYYVTFDGSSKITPISRYTTAVDKGQRVIVMIKNHEAIITGNVEVPAGYVETEEVDPSTNRKKLSRTASTKYVDEKVEDTQIESVPTSDIIALWNDYFN